MGYKITLNELKDIISQKSFANDGDDFEKAHWEPLRDRFPNCEDFWRHFIVPFTKRIGYDNIIPEADYTSESEFQNRAFSERIHPREGISQDIQDIASLHYSLFVHLVYSHEHLQNFGLYSFEDFYIHLVSASDLAEGFLLRIYLLTLECRGQQKKFLQKLDKEGFLKSAESWFCHGYSKACEDFIQEGKPVQKTFHRRTGVLDEYFAGFEDWKRYKSHVQKIREYRNVITHYVKIAQILSNEGAILVPKKERIQDYKRWSCVFEARRSEQKLGNDFVDMKKQMESDISGGESGLNELWTKPIGDLMQLFFHNKNKIVLWRTKYNIDIV